QTHTLPNDLAELESLARRLDFFDATQLASHFQQHRSAVRRIFEKYVGAVEPSTRLLSSRTDEPPVRRTANARLLSRLSEQDPLIVDWQPLDADNGQLTIVGFDQLGDLSMMCGLLFVHGFDIREGQVTTEEASAEKPKSKAQPLRFVNSFSVRRRPNVGRFSQPAEPFADEITAAEQLEK